MASSNTSSVKSVAAGTKISSIGTVKTIVGTVTATDASGVVRNLQVGDKVFTNDIIQTSAAGAILVEFMNGTHLDLGRSANATLDLDVFNPNQVADEKSDVAALQAQIAAGADPTQVTEASAAGAGAGDEGGSTFVVIDQAAPQGLVTSGFPTGPISTNFEQPASELPPVPPEAAAPVIPNAPPTLEITPPTYTPPEETPPPNTAPEGEVSPGQVFEEGLPGGSNAYTPSETATDGTITVGDPDGLGNIASITIGNTTFTLGLDGINTFADMVGKTVDGEHGTITITSYDGNGTFTYSYELTEATTEGVNDTDTFTVSVTDAAGASAGGAIIITIVDDVPGISLADAQTPAMSVDESFLPTGSTPDASLTHSAATDFSGVFSTVSGADGASVTYSLGINGTDSGLTDSASGAMDVLVMNGNVIEGHVGDAEGALAFKIEVDAGGQVTLTQYLAVHEGSGEAGDLSEGISLDSVANLVVLTATITDGDGDTATASIDLGRQISFLDDGPSISLANVETTPAVAVDESYLPTGSTPDGALTSATTDFSGAFAVTPGADGATTTYALVINGESGENGIDSGLVDSLTNESIVLVMNGTTVEGHVDTTDGALAFTLAVDAGGNVTLTDYRAVHQGSPEGTPPGDSSESISINPELVTLTATVTDADGDTATASIDLGAQVSFLDDGPSAFTPATGLLVDQTTAVHSVVEPLHFAASAGADGVGTVTFNFTDGDVATDAAGNPLFFKVDNVLQPLYLHYGADHTELIATTSQTTGGNTGFTIDIDPAGDTYTLTTNGILSAGIETTSATNNVVGGGNTAFKGLIDVGGTLDDVLVSTTANGTVNTNNATFGIGDGQSLSAGEQIRFDFVNDLSNVAPFPAGDATGFKYTSHNSVLDFKQDVIINGHNATANLTVTAMAANNDYSFIGDGTDTPINLTGSMITVYDQNGVVVADGTHGLGIDDTPTNSVTINGMQDGWSYEVNTGNTTFSAIEVDGASGTHTFKLGGFTYSEIAPASPVDLSYGITGTDGDGDAIASAINATLYPTTSSIEGTVGSDTLAADGTHHSVFGYGGDDILNGTSGNDILVGGDGKDLLTGGGGNDILSGDGGSDTFKFSSVVSNGSDTITDFTVAPTASGGDVLDISALLTGSGITQTQFLANPGLFLQFQSDNHGNTNVLFDADGGSAGTPLVIATLQGITGDPSALLNTLLGDSEIKSA